MPTLIDLCNVDPPETADFHGISLASRLRFEINQLTERVIVTDSQRVERPIKWKQSATMNQRWRLINGRELYDILLDPEQRQDLADQHPEVVQDLCQHYENWWDLVSPRFDEECPIIVGSDQEQISLLTSHDWHGQQHAWNQGQIRQGLVCNGYWAVDFAHDGEYHFELRRWPKEEDRRLTEGIPGDKIDLYNGGKALELQSATIKIGEYQQTQTISTSDKSVSFTFQLSAGETRLQTYLTDSGGLIIGAYYVYASRI